MKRLGDFYIIIPRMTLLIFAILSVGTCWPVMWINRELLKDAILFKPLAN
jgi:hypothetical protein